MNINNLNDLKKLSANWSSQQWEKYLSSLESPSKEVLIHPTYYKKLAQTRSISQIFEDLPLNEIRFRPKISIRQALDQLSRNERKVIIGLYWYNLTQEELAKDFQVSKQSISKFKTRALKKMKNFMSLNSLANLKLACTEEFKIS